MDIHLKRLHPQIGGTLFDRRSRRRVSGVVKQNVRSTGLRDEIVDDSVRILFAGRVARQKDSATTSGYDLGQRLLSGGFVRTVISEKMI